MAYRYLQPTPIEYKSSFVAPPLELLNNIIQNRESNYNALMSAITQQEMELGSLPMLPVDMEIKDKIINDYFEGAYKQLKMADNPGLVSDIIYKSIVDARKDPFWTAASMKLADYNTYKQQYDLLKKQGALVENKQQGFDKWLQTSYYDPSTKAIKITTPPEFYERPNYSDIISSIFKGVIQHNRGGAWTISSVDNIPVLKNVQTTGWRPGEERLVEQQLTDEALNDFISKVEPILRYDDEVLPPELVEMRNEKGVESADFKLNLRNWIKRDFVPNKIINLSTYKYDENIQNIPTRYTQEGPETPKPRIKVSVFGDVLSGNQANAVFNKAMKKFVTTSAVGEKLPIPFIQKEINNLGIASFIKDPYLAMGDIKEKDPMLPLLYSIFDKVWNNLMKDKPVETMSHLISLIDRTEFKDLTAKALKVNEINSGEYASLMSNFSDALFNNLYDSFDLISSKGEFFKKSLKKFLTSSTFKNYVNTKIQNDKIDNLTKLEINNYIGGNTKKYFPNINLNLPGVNINTGTSPTSTEYDDNTLKMFNNLKNMNALSVSSNEQENLSKGNITAINGLNFDPFSGSLLVNFTYNYNDENHTTVGSIIPGKSFKNTKNAVTDFLNILRVYDSGESIDFIINELNAANVLTNNKGINYKEGISLGKYTVMPYIDDSTETGYSFRLIDKETNVEVPIGEGKKPFENRETLVNMAVGLETLRKTFDLRSQGYEVTNDDYKKMLENNFKLFNNLDDEYLKNIVKLQSYQDVVFFGNLLYENE